MGLLDPTVAIVVALILLIILVYKRVNLGIVLNAAALMLGVLALDWTRIPLIIYQTTTDLLTISVVLATFAIMLLSQLYKETGTITTLSTSLSKIVNNPKIVLSALPAIIGLLPVAGGALTSAPLVDLEAEKLKLKPAKKGYINLWFRHTIFPIYPINQSLIVTAGLAGVAMSTIILRQIPVVAVMVIVGFIIGFWKIPNNRQKQPPTDNSKSEYKHLLISFLPILVAILADIIINLAFPATGQQGFDVLLSTVLGLVTLIAISKMKFNIFVKPFKSWGIYGITLAAYGAFLLRSMMVAAGISGIFKTFITNGSPDVIVLLTFIPAILGLLTGSPLGGASISISILAGILTFTPTIAALIYISAYLGYTVAPTHLCFQFTADYFKCPLGKMYRYVLPSFIVTFIAALLVYYLL